MADATDATNATDAGRSVPEDEFRSRAASFVSLSPPSSTNLAHYVKSLHGSRKYSDLTITCRGREFYVHKVILAGRSEYFKTLDDSLKCCDMDTDPKVLALCLEYMYKGTANVEGYRADQVARLSLELGIVQLYKDCCKYRLKQIHLSDKTCLEMWQMAGIVGDDDLVEKSEPLVLKKFTSLLHTQSFIKLTFEQICTLVAHPELCVKAPEERLGAALDWVRGNPSTRQEMLPSLLEHLPLKKFGEWFVRYTIEKDEVLQKNPKAIKILNAATNIVSPQMASYEHHGILAGVCNPCDDEPSHFIILFSTSLTDSYKYITSIPSGCKLGHIACCFGRKKLYVSCIGKKDVFQFDFKTGEWSQCGELKTSRTGHCMAVCNDNVYALGGRASDASYAVVRGVEEMKVGDSVWRETGRLNGVECRFTCACVLGEVDILVYGVSDQKRALTLQLYSTISHSVVQTLFMPKSEKYWYAPYGMIATNEHVILMTYHATYTCSITSIYEGDGAQITLSAKYRSPNTFCGVFQTHDTEHVVLMGGVPRDERHAQGVYRAPAKAVVQNTGAGWERVDTLCDIGRRNVYAGAACTATLPV